METEVPSSLPSSSSSSQLSLSPQQLCRTKNKRNDRTNPDSFTFREENENRGETVFDFILLPSLEFQPCSGRTKERRPGNSAVGRIRCIGSILTGHHAPVSKISSIQHGLGFTQSKEALYGSFEIRPCCRQVCSCAVFRRTGQHNLPGLGIGKVRASGDSSLRLWPEALCGVGMSEICESSLSSLTPPSSNPRRKGGRSEVLNVTWVSLIPNAALLWDVW